MSMCSVELFLKSFPHPSIHSTNIHLRPPTLCQTHREEVRENEADRLSAYSPVRDTEASECKMVNVTERGTTGC